MKIASGFVLLVLLTASSGVAQDYEVIGGFQTPSGNIHCLAAREGKTVDLRCDMFRNTARIPPKPASCEFDWGNYFGMEAVGKAKRLCVGDTVAGNYAKLPYGKKWVVKGAFTCDVTRDRLRCVNTSNRGFELAVARQKIF